MAINPTQNGTQPLKGVRGADLYNAVYGGNTYTPKTEDEVEAYNLYQTTKAMQGKKLGSATLTQIGNDPTTPEKARIDFGKSSYDEGQAFNSDQEDITNLRAESQNGFLQVANGVGKGLILAGTTFIGGTVGLAAGIIQFAANGINGIIENGDASGFDGSNFWNNCVQEALTSVEEWSEKAMPNYQSVKAQTGPWYENVFTSNFGNFLGDSVIKNFGFSIGAFYSGGKVFAPMLGKMTKALGKGVQVGTKAAQVAEQKSYWVQALGGSMLSAFGEGSIEAKHGAKEFIDQNDRVVDESAQRELAYIDSDDFLQDKFASLNADYAEELKIINEEYESSPKEFTKTNDGRYINKAELIRQQKVQALNQKYGTEFANAREKAKDEVYKNIDLTKKKIREDATSLGNSVLLWNLAILTGSNYVQFGKAFAGGFKPQKKASDILYIDEAGNASSLVGRGFRDGTKEFTTKELEEGLRRGSYEAIKDGVVSKTFKRYLKNPLSEGTEEWSQGLAVNVNKDYYGTDVANYYKGLVDPNAQQETLDYLNSIYNGVAKTVADPNAWLEFTIGAFTGAIGIPVLDKVNGKWKFKMEGGIKDNIKEHKEKEQREQYLVDRMNEYLARPENIAMFRGMNRHNFFQKVMDKAVEEDDNKGFKDAEFAQFFSDITAFDEAGRLQDLLDIIEVIDGASDVTAEDLQAMVENTTTTITVEQQRANLQEQIDILTQFYQQNQAKMSAEEGAEIIERIQELQEKKDTPGRLEPIRAGRWADVDLNTEEGQNEVRKGLKESANEMRKVISQYLESKKWVEDNFQWAKKDTGEALPSEKANYLAFLRAQALNWEERMTSMGGAIKEFVTEYAQEYIIKEFEESYGKLTEEEIANLGESAKKDYKEKKKAYDNMKKLLSEKPEVVAAMIADPANASFRESLMEVMAFRRADYNLKGKSITVSDAIKMMQDLGPIGKAIDNFTKTFDTFLKDHTKLGQMIKEANEAARKKGKNNEIRRKNQETANKSVSEIAREAIENETNVEQAEQEDEEIEIAEGEFEGFDDFDPNDENSYVDPSKPQPQPTPPGPAPAPVAPAAPVAPVGPSAAEIAAEKTRKAQEIVDKYNQAKRKLDEKLSRGEISQRQYNDALALIKRNLDGVEGAEQLLNIAKEDVEEDTLDDFDGSETMTDDELAEFNDRRVDEALSVLNDLNQELADIAEALEGIPDGEIDTNGTITRTFTVEEALQTHGADPQTQPQPVNAVTQTPEGVTGGETITQEDGITFTPTTETEVAEQIDEANKLKGEAGTPAQAEADAQTGFNPNKVDGQYTFWRTATTEFQIHRELGDNTPYWATLPDSHPMKKAYKATWEFLNKVGAFEMARTGFYGNNGKFVTFAISKELTKEAGVPVILIINSNNKIIGDLPLQTDAYPGLKEFYEEAVKFFNENKNKNDRDLVQIGGYTSSITRVMVGKPQYTATSERRSLNDIARRTDSDGALISESFTIGFATSNGRSEVVTANSKVARDPEQQRRTMRTASEKTKKGQPFLLMPTSSKERALMPVPFITPTFKNVSKDSSFYRAVKILAEEIATLPNDFDKIKMAMDRLRDFFVIEDSNAPLISFNKHGDITVKINGRIILVRKSDSTEENVDTLLWGLSNILDLPININKKYINSKMRISKDEEVDYNSMIGEIATTNLPEGGNHTVNDWFVINPIVNGREVKGKAPKSTGVNTNQRDSNSTYVKIPGRGTVRMTKDLKFYAIKENSSEEIDITDNPAYLPMRAYVYGIATKADMSKPYATPFNAPKNWYNANTNEFVEEPVVTTENPIDGVETIEDDLEGFDEFELDDLDGFDEFDPNDPDSFVDVGKNGPTAQPVAAQPEVKTNPQWDKLLDVEKAEITRQANEAAKKAAEEAAEKAQEEREAKASEALDKIRPLARDYLFDVLNSGSESLKSRYDEILRMIEEIKAIDEKSYNQFKEWFVAMAENSSQKYNEKKALEAAGNTTPVANRKDSIKKIKDAGMLTNTRSVTVEYMTDEQLARVTNMPKMKMRQFFERFDTKIKLAMNSVEAGIAIDSLFEDFFKREETSGYTATDINKEVERVKKMLPQLSHEDAIRIVESLQKLSEMAGGDKVWGLFQDGIIYLANNSSRGTAYHEAFHYVSQTLMTEKELDRLYSQAAKVFGEKATIALEEDLAEGFRKYMQGYEEVENKRGFAKYWGKLKHYVKTLVGKEAQLNKLYRDIRKGGWANRQAHESSSSLNMNEQYSAEMQSILKSAKRDKDGRLLAPNGKPTNLTERQYAHVRTKAFKDWFGDWENDPANASKVVDENGEPKIVYHGTSDTFDTFRMEEGGKSTGSSTYIDKKTGEQIPVDSIGTVFFSDLNSVAFSYAAISLGGKEVKLRNSMLELRNLLMGEQSEIKGYDDLMKVLDAASVYEPRFRKLADYLNKLREKGVKLNERERAAAMDMAIDLYKFLKDRGQSYAGNAFIFNHDIKVGEEFVKMYNNRRGVHALLNGEVPSFIKTAILENKYKIGVSKVSVDIGFYSNIAIEYSGSTGLKIILDTQEFNVKSLSEDKLYEILDSIELGLKSDREQWEKEYGDIKKLSTVHPMFLNIRNPLVHDYEGSEIGEKYKNTNLYTGYVQAKQANSAKKSGNDGVIYENVVDPFNATNYGIFDPNQAKSADYNVGTYSRSNNNFYHRDMTSEEVLQSEIEDLEYELRSTDKGRKVELDIIDAQYKALLNSSKSRIINNRGESIVMYGTTQYLTEGEARAAIPVEFNRIMKVAENRGRYYLMSSLQTVAKAKKYAEDSVAQEKKQLQKAIAKLKYSIENRNFFAEKLESYKRAKLENLSSEDLAYLNERGVSVEEFKSWTTLEQETFLKCR
jgi:hypothetical protein